MGTRAQIHMFMIRKKSDAYQLAQEDIKKAMEEFKNPSDIRRQQIYLTQIHTEAKEYDKALETLCESSCDLQKCLKNAETNPFEAYAYIRLMSEGKRNGWEKADVMYQELNKTQIISDLKKYRSWNILMRLFSGNLDLIMHIVKEVRKQHWIVFQRH